MTTSPHKSARPAATARIRPSFAGLLFCLGALLFGAILLGAQQPPLPPGRPAAPEEIIPGNSEDASDQTQLSTQVRLSEGTQQIDQVGYFKLTDDRVTFFAEDGMSRYVGLENLDLQRIHRAIAGKPRQLWSVSGMFTEYFGDNYLFVERAVLVTDRDAFAQSVSANR